MPLVTPSTVQIVIDAQNKASAKLSEISKDLDKLEKDIDSFSKTSDGMTSANDDAAISFGAMNTAFIAYSAAVAAATVAVTAFVKAYQFGEIAAQNQRLAESGAEMARQYGGSMDLIVEKVREASLNTVSDLDIIASANKAIMLGLGADADTLANLMEIAAFRARAMGISTTQAFDDIVRGIGRSSPLILDNLGIIVKLGEVNEEYAEGLGKTTQELTAAEKKQALLNAVLDEGNAMLAKAGGLVADNATEYERFSAQLENTKNLLLDNASFMDRFASMGADFLMAFQEVNQNGIEGNVFETFFNFVEKRIQAGKIELMDLANAGTAWENNQKNNLVLLSQSAAAYGVYNETIALTEEEIKAMTQANQGYLDTVASITGEIQKYSDKEASLKEKHKELIAEKQKLIAQGWNPESDKITEINGKLAENEAAMQKNADEFELAGRRRILSMLEQQLAIGGLSAAETDYLLGLGLQWGVYSQQAVDAARAAQAELAILQATFDQLPESKDIRLNVLVSGQQAVRNFMEADAQFLASAYAEGTGGWRTVPPGYPNDSYPVLMSSGERFAVIPNGQAQSAPLSGGMGGGAVVLNLTYSPMMSLGDETELRTRLVPLIISGVKEARAQGVIQ